MGTQPEKQPLFATFTCAFTGHRNLSEPEPAVSARLEALLHQVIARGYQTFLSGMAWGFDLLAAEAVLKLKSQYPHIRLFAVLPCPSQEQTKYWQEGQKRRYHAVLEQACEILTICPAYTSGCLTKRNQFLVQHSTLLIAYQTRSSGGTAATVSYARQMGLWIVSCGPDGSVKSSGFSPDLC